ncbi:hypothetical protein ACFO3O_14690 [Dokdonia ponticola]|uniref:DUF2975 domain-containing protein n=1 Tax=Dokdonia ponticola TaxID=2041041 RepID=A0ABV9HYA8_9FLAO
MTKIKILLGIILIVVLFNFFKLFYYFFNLNSLDELLNSDTQAHFLIFVYALTIMIFFVAQIALSKGIWHIISQGYFNSKSIKSIRLSGILLLLFGIIMLIWRLYTVFYYSEYSNVLLPYNVVQAIENGYTIILGFGLITIASVLKNGLHIKSENELTI